MVNMDFDTAKKRQKQIFNDWNHHRDVNLDEAIEINEERISELENEVANLETNVQELKLEAHYWKRRAEELEGNINGLIDRRERELAETAFDDRNDAEAKRQIHGD